MKRYGLLLLPLLALLAQSCATPGGSQTEATIYDMHARTVRLEKNLGELNESSAQLTAQVESNDRDMEQLRSMLDESQMRLAQLEQSLSTLQETMYGKMGLTTPSKSAYVPTGPGPEAVIEPPAASMPAPAPAPAPALAPQATDTPPPFETSMPTAPAPVPAPATATPVLDEAEAMRAYNQAQEAYKAEKYQQALDAFNNFLATYPTSEHAVKAQFFKASSQQRLGQYIESIESYQTLKSQYPTSTWVPIAVYNQAVAHAKLGELDVAKSILNNLIVQYPATPAAEQAKIELEKLQQY